MNAAATKQICHDLAREALARAVWVNKLRNDKHGDWTQHSGVWAVTFLADQIIRLRTQELALS